MQERPDSLLEYVRPEPSRREDWRCPCLRLASDHVRADEVSVVLLDRAAQELKRHGQENDTDAGPGKHAARGDVPAGGDEARVDCVPVPQHLARSA